MRFSAIVKSPETGEKFKTKIRVIILDQYGQPEAVIGATGLRYDEFELIKGDE